MTSTIEDLSIEILVEIFSHYIESEGHKAFSLLVAPVCKTWWEASSTRSLWKTFRFQNWNYTRFVCNKGLLEHTQSLEIPPPRGNRRRPGLLDSSHLSDLLKSINDLKSLEISNYDIDRDAMVVVAKHCPNLERFSMKVVETSDGNRQVTLVELSPILNICGPKLKHISFICCNFGDIKQLLTDIADKCKSLETFELNNNTYCLGLDDRNMFPIYKLASGCPRLQKLKLSNCRLVTTGENDFSGFEDLTAFKAERCCSHKLDISSLLKNSTKLECLELRFLNNFVLSDVSKIPSNNLNFLSIWLNDTDTNLEVVKQAVDKWKHTLLHLQIYSQTGDLTNILSIYLDNNPHPKLEKLWIDKECVDMSFLKIFIQECQNLNELCILKGQRLRLFVNREKIMEFVHSI